MDDRHIEPTIFSSTSGLNMTTIARSSTGKDGNYGRTLSMLKSVDENIGSSGDARLADDCCRSGAEPKVNYYWSHKKIAPTQHEHQSDTSWQLDEEAIVAADESLQRTNLKQKTEVSSPLSVKEMRRLKWHRIRLDMERHSRLDGVEEADKLPKRTRTGKESGISYPISEKENQRQTTTNNRFPAYSNDASPSRYPPLCNEDNELKKDRSCSLDNIAKQGFSGPFPWKTQEARMPMYNTLGEREKECVKEESLVTPARNNVNEEVSPGPITSPPMEGLNGYSVPSQPAVDPIWRGTFDIVNQKDNLLEGFVAHLSRSACQRAIEEARLLPAFLQLEMVPKSTVWPKTFQETCPIDYHIALYIFPTDRRYEKKFDLLVDEMSKRELALRTFTKNAELLIFSSTELEMPYWRYRNKYYIWGVFRGKI